MKLYRIIPVLAIVNFLPACTTQAEFDCDSNIANFSFDPGSTKVTPPNEIPGTAKMTTVIGPIAPNLAKWGPENEDQPFSWPGRAVQLESTYPTNPSEQLIYEVRLPENSNLYKVHVWVDPANAHVDVPASRAQAMVWTHNGGFHENHVIASSVTPANSVDEYEQRYLLTMEFDEPYKMKSDTRVFVYVFGEWGDNTMPGLVVDTPEIVYDSIN